MDASGKPTWDPVIDSRELTRCKKAMANPANAMNGVTGSARYVP